MHLQTAISLGGSINQSPSPRDRRAPKLGAPAAACLFPFPNFAGFEGTDQELAHVINQAIVSTHEIGHRQTLSPRPDAATFHVIIEGWAFRSQILPNGARQITELLVPGDFCSTPYDAEEPYCEIEACGPVCVAMLDMEQLTDGARSFAEHVQRRQHADVLRRLRAGLVSLGRRDGRERLAYLVAETYSRLAQIGLSRDGAFAWPFTQEHLADILGLTPVHINRVVARLRNEDVLIIRKRHVAILNLASLCRIGGFEDLGTCFDESDYGLL